MSKGLDALKYFKNPGVTAMVCVANTLKEKDYKENLYNIEKELKALEIIKKYSKNDGWSDGWCIEFWNMSEKEIKLVNEVFNNE